MDRATRNLIVDRLKKVDQWSRSALSALDAAEEKLREDGCDCGTDDPPCALCVVQRAIKTFPR